MYKGLWSSSHLALNVALDLGTLELCSVLLGLILWLARATDRYRPMGRRSTICLLIVLRSNEGKKTPLGRKFRPVKQLLRNRYHPC